MEFSLYRKLYAFRTLILLLSEREYKKAFYRRNRYKFMTEPPHEHSLLDARFDELWPIPRSITGPGFRESLKILKQDIPLEIESVPSGTAAFDWKIPPEWRIHEAQLTRPDGTVVADFDETNLAIVNYSKPVDTELSSEQLDDHLYTLPEHPDAIPYVTSYYDRTWGFCLPHNRYKSLPDGNYHAYIDSEFVDGELNYGHTVLEGESDREVLLTTYLCHPSLANNELSGPLVMTALYRRLAEWDNRKFTYRFVVAPETIGSVAYLSRYGEQLQKNMVAGLVLTCLGGPRDSLSYKQTRREETLLDSVVRHVDTATETDFRFRRFTTDGSDERQYCSPGFNLPVGQFARTVYGEYAEYHTSMDTKEFMGIDPLIESANRIEQVLRTLEYGGYYLNQKPYGEPMMSKRDCYPTVNSPTTWEDDQGENTEDESTDMVRNMMRLLHYGDGNHSVVEIANRCDLPVTDFVDAIDCLQELGLLEPDSHVPQDKSLSSTAD